MTRKFTLCFASILLSVLLISGAAAQDDPEYARVRLGHYAINTPVVDVYLDESAAFRAVPFGSMTNYLTVPAALYTLAVVPETADADSTRIMPSLEGRLLPDRTYTIALIGDGDAPQNVIPLAVTAQTTPESRADATAEVTDEPIAENVRAVIIDETSLYETAAPGLAHVIVLSAISGDATVDARVNDSDGLSDLRLGESAAVSVQPNDGVFTLDVIDAQGAVLSHAETELELRGDLVYFLTAAGSAEDSQVYLQVAGTKSLAELLSEGSEFSTFYAVVQDAELEPLLRNDGPFTIFAPNNAAFAAYMTANDLYSDTLLSDTTLINALVRAHTARGLIFSDNVSSALLIPMIDGTDAAVTTTDSTITLNDRARIVIPDVLATNGVIHVIDQVLEAEAPPD